MTRRVCVAGLLGLLVGCSGSRPPLPEAVPGPFDHTYAAWDELLAAHVADGRVDYAGLDRAALERVIAALATPTDVDTWSRARRTAFWINAYNALVVRVVLDHPGITSIKDVGVTPYAAFRAPVARFRCRPDALSLDDIEKGELLGSDLWDARLHMALNCASRSCPPLRARAWRADDLDATLDAAARAFLADTAKNRWNAPSGQLYLSRIFAWYQADFTRAAGSVDGWVARYGPPTLVDAVAGPHAVVYPEYDWGLNGR